MRKKPVAFAHEMHFLITRPGNHIIPQPDFALPINNKEPPAPYTRHGAECHSAVRNDSLSFVECIHP